MTPLATLLIGCEKIVSTKSSSMGYVEWRWTQNQFHTRLSWNNLGEHWNQSSLHDHEWNTYNSELLGCNKFLCSIQALFYQCFSRWGKWPFTSSTFGSGSAGFNANWQLTRGVSRCSLAIYIKECLKAKEELWKFKFFTMQKCNLQKKSL
jgi:hypothetical protein